MATSNACMTVALTVLPTTSEAVNSKAAFTSADNARGISLQLHVDLLPEEVQVPLTTPKAGFSTDSSKVTLAKSGSIT